MPLISESQPDHNNRNYTYMYVPYSYEKTKARVLY